MAYPPDESTSRRPSQEYQKYIRRAVSAQGATARIADLLLFLRQTDPGDDDIPVAVGEDDQVVLSPDSAWALFEAAAQSLPRCYSSPRGLLEDGCAMPDAVCHRCAAEGRRIESVRTED